jgi:hypothetical protein
MLYNTSEEEKAIEIIKRRFPDYAILNPNTRKHQTNCNEVDKGIPGTEMPYFLNLTKMCEFGVFLVYDENKWSPGSYTEASYMINDNKKVYLLSINNWRMKRVREIENYYDFNEEKEKLIKQGKDPAIIYENG